MATTTFFPGRYIQGRGVLERMPQEIGRLGSKVFIIAGNTAIDKILPLYLPEIEKNAEVKAARFGGECCEEEIDTLLAQAKDFETDLVIGLGGGKVLDTSKIISQKLDAKNMIIPTLASSDAPCSAIAVLYTSEGIFKKGVKINSNPQVVLVDTEIITQAPVRLLVAGMGDALATWFEAESSRQTGAANFTLTGDNGSMTAYALARLCYDTLLEYGLAAKKSCEAKVVTPALDKVVEANILLSGIGFESGGLATAHAIHDGMTVLEDLHQLYHGEKVAFGTLASLFLTGKEIPLINEVYAFCESVGLPATFYELGIEGIADKELMKIAEASCHKYQSIHNEPFEVNPEDVADAMKAADKWGRMRKGM